MSCSPPFHYITLSSTTAQNMAKTAADCALVTKLMLISLRSMPSRTFRMSTTGTDGNTAATFHLTLAGSSRHFRRTQETKLTDRPGPPAIHGLVNTALVFVYLLSKLFFIKFSVIPPFPINLPSPERPPDPPSSGQARSGHWPAGSPAHPPLNSDPLIS